MEQIRTIRELVPDTVISDLERRDAALWLYSIPEELLSQEDTIQFIGLPWRMVLSEISDPDFLHSIEKNTTTIDSLPRKRGYIHLIDGDPSRIELPQRCLPIYLLNGGRPGQDMPFQARFRRMAMLEELRRSNVRQLVIISDKLANIPSDLKELCTSGFRANLTFIVELDDYSATFSDSIREFDKHIPLTLLPIGVGQAIATVVTQFTNKFPEERVIIRLRDRSGDTSLLDITEIDDPERPLLDFYDIIQERDLSFLSPEQLSEAEFASFFQSVDGSWVPYAAGIPWQRDKTAISRLQRLVANVDATGPEANCVAYFTSEPGAGGTTLARMLAWDLAQTGYPVLVAKSLSFVPDALPVANFLNRVRIKRDGLSDIGQPHKADAEPNQMDGTRSDNFLRYEVPWIIVFDRIHWEYHGSELRRFRNALEKQGRPVCLLVVAGPIREIEYFDTSVFREIGELNHALDRNEALSLGRHLNKFLRVYGKARHDWQWEQFYQDHTVRYLEGVAAFWVTLSFWIRGQYDLSESVQEWMYRCFKREATASSMQFALLEIAALSSERRPYPEGLLSTCQGEWPIAHLLEDSRSTLGPLGLARISAGGGKHWALIHDILGRFLITGLFYDHQTRQELGFDEAKDPEHLRLLLLKRISAKPELSEIDFRELGEDFATTIFKIDPDHGYGMFSDHWRDVLQALDDMPKPLQDSSRVFRHHSAVSRRRIAKLDKNIFGVHTQDKVDLLNRAIVDIKYALESIEYVPGSEPNINLYNSLAHAYHDLADVEETRGAGPEYVGQLRRRANDATRRAYEENPTNSFVVETYVRDLLTTARSNADVAVQCCIDIMGILFSAISSHEASYRRAQLGDLADRALAILLTHAPRLSDIHEPSNALEVLTKAWIVLAEGVDHTQGTALSDLPEENRRSAIEVLADPMGRGNMQVLRLRYDLVSSTYMFSYRRQLEYVEQLAKTDYRITPQIRLEYAILLYQTDRPKEGERAFRNLRRLWRDTEHFVHVPNRLRWLRDGDTTNVKTVHAVVGSDRDVRPMARIGEFQNVLVPFRPEEFGMRNVRPGIRFSGRVAFGHNGPFLRPPATGGA